MAAQAGLTRMASLMYLTLCQGYLEGRTQLGCWQGKISLSHHVDPGILLLHVDLSNGSSELLKA